MAAQLTNFLTTAQEKTFEYLPPLEDLTQSSSTFTSNQKLQFYTLFACGLITTVGGIGSCCLSPGNFKDAAKSLTVSMLGLTTLVASYMLLGSFTSI